MGPLGPWAPPWAPGPAVKRSGRRTTGCPNNKQVCNRPTSSVPRYRGTSDTQMPQQQAGWQHAHLIRAPFSGHVRRPHARTTSKFATSPPDPCHVFGACLAPRCPNNKQFCTKRRHLRGLARDRSAKLAIYEAIVIVGRPVWDPISRLPRF